MERSKVQEFDILTLKVRVNRNLKLTKHSWYNWGYLHFFSTTRYTVQVLASLKSNADKENHIEIVGHKCTCDFRHDGK